MHTKLLVVLSLTSFLACATAPPAPTPGETAPPAAAVAPVPRTPPPDTTRLGEPSNTRLDGDAKSCSKPGSEELTEFYLKHRPPHALYFFRILRSGNAAFIVIIRANESKERVPEKYRSPHLPAVEKIIGPIVSKQDWHVVFAYLRTYAVAPPAGNYCWEDDCYGFFNRRLDNNEGDFPAPGQNPPDWPPVSGMVVSADKVLYGSLDVERRVRMALAGATDRQIELATVQDTPPPASSASTVRCPNDDATIKGLKDQARRILDAATPMPTK
jgi:hypothetical protein